MGTYVPFFKVSVTNSHFSGLAWPGLEFVASAATRKLLDAAGLVVKKTPFGAQLLRDSDRDAVMQSYADDGAGRLQFSFNIFIKDRLFANYTSIPSTDSASILLFNNLRFSEWQSDHAIRISSAEHVSVGDVIDVASAAECGYVDAEDETLRPHFVVSITVRFPVEPGEIQPDFSISFAARQSYWQYFFLGAMKRENLFIADVDNAVEFEQCGDAIVYGNRVASVFRSKSTLPVLERSPYRFQLKESGYGNGRILIKRLPVASDKLSLEVIDGKSALVANNYVNY